VNDLFIFPPCRKGQLPSFLVTYLVMGLCSAFSREKIGSYLVCMTVATDCIHVSRTQAVGRYKQVCPEALIIPLGITVISLSSFLKSGFVKRNGD